MTNLASLGTGGRRTDDFTHKIKWTLDKLGTPLVRAVAEPPN